MSEQKTEKKNNENPEKLIFLNQPAEQYDSFKLDVSDLVEDPFEQFKKWFAEAEKKQIPVPEATTLSTASLPSGKISSRVVLLKELDRKGFVIFSNWESSKKSQDINSNPHAALSFFWKELQRQVRIEGVTEFLSPEESTEYFNTRIRSSQIGAWASPQSQPLQDREELDSFYKEIDDKFKNSQTIPRPPYWGGLRVIPYYIEFWQGRPSRLHDRFAYTRENVTDEKWDLTRLAP